MSNLKGNGLTVEAMPFDLKLRYPLAYFSMLTKGRCEGWNVRYRHPWIELWRSPVLHAYSLFLDVDRHCGYVFFPQSWISLTWFEWSADVRRHRKLVTGLLDQVTGFDTTFASDNVSGKRDLDEVSFSGVARTPEDVDDIAARLRAQVLQMQEGREVI